MSKKICKLEKETSSWKQRWERSHNALLEMGADKQKSEQELVVVSRQLATLQGLCRTLQAERATLTAKLKILQGNFHLWTECFEYLFKQFPLVGLHIKFGGCNLLWKKKLLQFTFYIHNHNYKTGHPKVLLKTLSMLLKWGV